MSLFYQTVNKILKLHFQIFHKHKVYGLENIPKGKVLIASNHASFYDPLIIGFSFPEELYYFARSTLFSRQFSNFILRQLNAYPISSKDLSAFDKVEELLKKDKKIVIFPEGMRSKTGEMMPFKGGICKMAIKNNVSILPVYLVGTYDIWPPHQKFPNFKGHTACIIGSPFFIESQGNLDSKTLQTFANDLYQRLNALKTWYESGAEGTPP